MKKKILILLVVCLMFTGLVGQNVYGWGERQYRIPTSSNIPKGWMIESVDQEYGIGGWYDVSYDIINLNDAPFGVEVQVARLYNLPKGWVEQSYDEFSKKYTIKNTNHDTQPPTPPYSLKVVDRTSNSITLNWLAASDNVGIAGYKVYKDSSYIGITSKTSYTVYGIEPGRGYEFAVRATDGENDSIPCTIDCISQAPSAPNDLKAYTKTCTSITLTWLASSDDVGVTGYKIYKDSNYVGTTTGTSYTVNGLKPGQGYRFAVRATDRDGNESYPCYLDEPTESDNEAPTAPSNLNYTSTFTSITLSWTASTDNVGVLGYNVYKNGDKIATLTGTTYTITGLTPNTQYQFAVTARDTVLESEQNVVFAATNYDYAPPSSPTNLICAEKYDTSLKLSWSASTDNMAVAGYSIYKDGVKIGSTKNLSYAVSDLEHDSTYVFSIQAYDTVGNTSTSSSSLTVLMDSNLTAVPYCAGYYTFDDGDTSTACYWQGSTRVDLAGDGTPLAFAESIYVYGDTVYAAGYYYDGGIDNPCYWKGSTRVNLAGDGTHPAYANSIYVNGDTVYTAGCYNIAGGKAISCYWKGSTRVDLAGDGTHNASAYSICVNGDTVYTAGWYSDGSKRIPCYWKGTTRVDLAGDGTHDAWAKSICVKGDTVYTAGYYSDGSKNIPCYWKGSTRVGLAGDGTHSAYASSICVNGDTVYTAGFYNNGSTNIPCYWKGSTRVDLAGDGTHNASAYSICVNGDTVYTAGCYYDGINNIPCYWKGETRVDLAVDGTSAVAFAIFIPLTCN